MAQKPPSWSRFDRAGQVPLMLSRDVDDSGVQDPGKDARVLAEQMVRQQQTVINRFIAVQRQQIELGEKDIHNAVLALDGMDVYYTHVQGLERMHYHVRPEAEAPEVLEAPVSEEPNFLTQKLPTLPGPFIYVSAVSPALYNFWSVSGFSLDGKKWGSLNSYINTPNCVGLTLPPARTQVSGGPATYLTCCIRGITVDGTITIVAGGGMGYRTVDSLNNPDMTTAAVVMVSTDNGASWTDGGIPVDKVGYNQFNRSQVLTVGFDGKFFYATSSNTLWDVIPGGTSGDSVTFTGTNYRTYLSATGSGWSLFSETFVPAPTSGSTEVAPLPYPDGCNVASGDFSLPDQPLLNKPKSKKYNYLATSGPHQPIYTIDDQGNHTHTITIGIPSGDGFLVTLAIDGKDAGWEFEPYAAATNGKDIIVVGIENVIGGDDIEHHQISSDFGRTWQEIPALTGMVSPPNTGFAPFIMCSPPLVQPGPPTLAIGDPTNWEPGADILPPSTSG